MVVMGAEVQSDLLVPANVTGQFEEDALEKADRNGSTLSDPWFLELNRH